MSDLISRNEVIKQITKACLGQSVVMVAEERAIYNIRKIPSPLIHCKDCKHFVEDVWAVMNGLPVIVCHEACYRWSEDGNKVGAEGFCCLAERKDDDDK